MKYTFLQLLFVLRRQLQKLYLWLFTKSDDICVNRMITYQTFSKLFYKIFNFNTHMITSSNLSVILDQHPIKTDIHYLCEKKQLIPKITNFDNRIVSYVKVSHKKWLVDDYEEKICQKIQHVGMIIHHDIPYLSGSPDGICDNGDIVVIKKFIKILPPKYYT